MTEKAREYEGPDEWDFDSAELRRGSSEGRTVVSVSMAREDFARLSDFAEKLGMRPSEFIRRAALGRLQPRKVVIFSATAGHGSLILTGAAIPKTAVWGQVTYELAQNSQAEQEVLGF